MDHTYYQSLRFFISELTRIDMESRNGLHTGEALQRIKECIRKSCIFCLEAEEESGESLKELQVKFRDLIEPWLMETSDLNPFITLIQQLVPKNGPTHEC